ncbi:type II toxin-antitoxin system RelE/ParE family toxin [Streptomyces sp. ISL-1]|uniref:type II toxin-antitoxin system RelE/ParE family toxin n=1 Tax=Streptomyces sp. ISL-1 TaxID=2817657 RepID=UPI001BE96339|nr:type II toxin-antitoxin system RelE/ParE family toxin [Streptomyces sp. ISL-1]MBT2389926.1 type II toxin-antitoxin system RelE/ParE family toxin [Streptomyces sp. ISL-1]
MIEAARVSDGTYPCDDFLRGLEGSKRKKDRERLAVILIVLEDYAYRRELIFPREINNLKDGIRELKPDKVRLPFFDVPGSKVGAIRLTHGFVKGTQKAPRGEILKALWVRREDLAS